MNKQDDEEKGQILDELINKSEKIQTSQIEELIVDFVLKCIRGVFQNKFLFLNLTPEGETFGSDPNEDLSLYVENAGFSKKHAEIKYDPSEKRYLLRDLGSESGIWIKNRNENPTFIRDNTIFRIGSETFVVNFKHDPNFDVIMEWLGRLNLKKIYDNFKGKKINSLKEIQELSDEELRKLDLNEIERENLITAISEISIDFKDDFIADKLILRDFKNDISIEVSLAGAYIGTIENADLILNGKSENDDEEELIEVAIRYQNGNYWLVTSKQNTAEVYGKLSEKESYILQPDDIINIGELDFLVQRFNTGYYADKGTRSYMEDIIVIRQQLGISNRLNVSFFAVFDGHGGTDCVKYVAEYLIENLRTNLLDDESFDNQEDFYKFIRSAINKSFQETDKSFYEEFKEITLNSGCACLVVLIIGDYILCANLGDSRAVLSKRGKAFALSIDQKPNSELEKNRINNAGGNVVGNRVEGALGVSRALGDFAFKPVSRGEKNTKFKADIVLGIPEIRITKIDYLKDEFLFLASDGLFDAYSSQKCVDYIRERLIAFPLMEQDCQSISKQLVLDAINDQTKKGKGGSDNVSVIIIALTRGLEKLD